MRTKAPPHTYTDLVSCRACPLFEGTTQVVGGDGPQPAEFLFIAEAPGAVEDRVGRPLVGPSGKLFDRLLTLAGLRRENVRVDNVVRHRPPLNRTPKAAEWKACQHWTQLEIENTRPKVIVTLGATPLKVFAPDLKLESDHGVGRARIRYLTAFGPLTEHLCVLVPWYHPAAALRDPERMQTLVRDARRLHDQIAAAREPRLEPIYWSGVGEITSRLVGFDTETTSPKRGGVFQASEARLLGYSLSTAPHIGTYEPSPNMSLAVRDALSSKDVVKVIHNAKFEYNVLAHKGVILDGFEDTMIAAYLLGEPTVGLKDLTVQHLGGSPLRYDDIVPKGGDVRDAEPASVVAYAAADADNARRLWVEVLRERLERHDLMKVYRDIELPLVPVLARAEAVGVRIDLDEARRVKDGIEETLRRWRGALTALLEIDNPNSHEQVARALERLGAPIKRRTTMKKLLSTDDADLKTVMEWNPAVVVTILNFRKYGKLLGYVDNFLELTDSEGRLHASFNQAGSFEEAGEDSKRAPRTGRLSSSGPNLQNNPHHADEAWGQRIRSLFVAEPGFLVMSCDVSQEEPRIIAVRAHDEALLSAFERGIDIYRHPAELIYPDTIDHGMIDSQWKQRFEHQRFIGKTGFLAWYYGAGAQRFLELDPAMGRQRAERAVHALNDGHPARQRYLTEVEAEARANGYVRTMFGRIIWASEAYAVERKVIADGLRKWANGIIQGTGADILKLALVRLQRRLDDEHMRSRMTMFVHDEVVLEVAEAEVDKVADMVIECFQGLLPIALPVEVNVGPNWGNTRRIH